MEERVRVGVIGVGAISGAYLGMATNFPIVEMAAVADLDPERAKAAAEKYQIPQVMTVDKLIADSSIELVLNLTVPKAHVPIGLQILGAGKHTYVEKPLGINRAEGEKLVALAKSKNLRVGCAPDTFMGAGIQTARKLIDDGVIGKPVAFTAFMMCPGHESWHPSPEFYYEVGGGPMFDMGPYYLTALLNLFGPVKRLSGLATVAIPERTITSEPKKGKQIKVETPDHFSGSMEFENGVMGTIIQSFATRFPTYDGKQPITVYGTEGTMRVPDPNGFDGPGARAEERGCGMERVARRIRERLWPQRRAGGHGDGDSLRPTAPCVDGAIVRGARSDAGIPGQLGEGRGDQAGGAVHAARADAGASAVRDARSVNDVRQSKRYAAAKLLDSESSLQCGAEISRLFPNSISSFSRRACSPFRASDGATHGEHARRLHKFVAILLILLAATTQSSSPTGHWEGAVQLPGSPLVVYVDLVEKQGAWSGTIDIPQQHAKHLKLDPVSVAGSSVRFIIDGVPGDPTFDGKLADGHIAGTFTQAGLSIPFKMGREKFAIAPPASRPAEPAVPTTAPIPYTAEDVSYDNGPIHLAATLTIPQGKGPFPAVVLITGSGAQNRDEEIMGHRPFYVIADILTRAGIAVLRADDRGVGGSTGGLVDDATTDELAGDTVAGIEFLKNRPEVAKDRIGLIGHSEGAIIAPLIASRDPDVAFIVMLAGSGVPGDQIIERQSALLEAARGEPSAAVDRQAHDLHDVLAMVEADGDPVKMRDKVRAQVRDQLLAINPTTQPSEKVIDVQTTLGMDRLTSRWFRNFLTYDPRPAMRNVKVPTLVLAGIKTCRSIRIRTCRRYRRPLPKRAIRQ